jgi:hypothetical protein
VRRRKRGRGERAHREREQAGQETADWKAHTRLTLIETTPGQDLEQRVEA